LQKITFKGGKLLVMQRVTGKVKLFCFPYAGGSALSYSKLNKYLNKSIELYPVELAGRGKRFNDPLYNTVEEAIDDLFNRIEKDISNSEFAFFGHSMGTVFVYELIKKLNRMNMKKPVHAFLSGRYPPNIHKGKILHTLGDEEFKKEIFELGGTPLELFENKQLSNIFIPILKADYKIIETYEFKGTNSKWDFDITVLNGKDDVDVKMEDVVEWKEYTKGNCEFINFDGGHFYLFDKLKEVADVINNKLSNFL
jgi:medium-chain acyl-[acyl-carrier-protein] hydrolase